VRADQDSPGVRHAPAKDRTRVEPPGLAHPDAIEAEVLGGAYTRRVREDFKSGVRGGVNGTPTFFINGERYDGARGLEPLLAALQPGVW